jgi:hypothetical protein
VASVFIRYRISDYDQWRKGFDDAQPLRQAAGVTAHSAHRDADDPNMIIIAARVSDLGRAREFYNSAELRQRMEAAGIWDPQFWFTEDIEDQKY